MNVKANSQQVMGLQFCLRPWYFTLEVYFCGVFVVHRMGERVKSQKHRGAESLEIDSNAELHAEDLLGRTPEIHDL